MTATIIEIVSCSRSLIFSPAGNYSFMVQPSYIHRIIIVVQINSWINPGNIIGKVFLCNLFSLTWVKNLILPHSEAKLDKVKVVSSFCHRMSNYRDTNFCKLEVDTIFAILVRDVFRAQLIIYVEAFWENS